MAKGWEVAIRVQEDSAGWGSTVGASARPGYFLFVDSETLAKNTEIKERDAKIIPMRLSPVESVSVAQQSPGGQVVFQPRTDDVLPVLMAFFQNATLIGGGSATVAGTTGTWSFTPVGQSLAWSGVAFGTSSVYPINIDKYYGAGLTGTGDGIRFERGVVTRLTIDQQPAEDLKITADLRFLQATDEAVLGTGFKSAPNSVGSFSEKKQLVDWNGTVSVGGSSYAVEKITFEFDNSVTERRKLGQKGFYQFPFGRAIFSGNFDVELEDMSVMKEGTTGGTLVAKWQTSDGDFLEIFCPNIYYRASDPQVGDTGPVMRTVAFRCYPTTFGGSNAVVVNVYPKYGTVGPSALAKLVFA